MLNAIVSKDSEFCTADIKNFYFGTSLDRKQYMHIPLKHIPLDIQKRYNIESMAKAYTACHRPANLHKTDLWHT